MLSRNEIPGYVTVATWIIVNAYLFASSYLECVNEEKYYYLSYLTKGSWQFARASAVVLNFNCLMIILPVCRNLLTYLRLIPFLPRNFGRIIDKNLSFHKMIAWTICLATIVHVISHVYNYERFSSSWKSDDVITRYVNSIGDDKNAPALNPIRKEGADPILQLLSTLAGTTGIIMTLALILMVLSSTKLIHDSHYEVFWITHHLFVVFYIGLILHGLGGLLRYQDNTNVHNPVNCWNMTKLDNETCPTPPHFSKNTAYAWLYVIAPLLMYFIERWLRFCNSWFPCVIKKVVKHSCKVIEIQMTKPGFSAEVGQYIYLQCPTISKMQWHPFTLTSCPEDEFFSVHIAVLGNWTRKLANLCDVADQDIQSCSLKLVCDGPYGAPTTDVFRYKTVMFVGAGIGITPFASVLKSLWYWQQKKRKLKNVKKVYFYWICRDINPFKWLAELLLQLKAQMIERGMPDFLDYNIYLTQAGEINGNPWTIALHDHDTSIIDDISDKTKFGRPEWDTLFRAIQHRHQGTNIGFFCCGPPGLCHDLHRFANKYTVGKTKFFFNKEQ